jgi:hypothetical protein
MDYETKIYSLIVKPVSKPIYSEQATIIRMDDEGAGPYIVIEQQSRDSSKVSIDCEEWPHIRAAIDQMLVVTTQLSRPDDAK